MVVLRAFRFLSSTISSILSLGTLAGPLVKDQYDPEAENPYDISSPRPSKRPSRPYRKGNDVLSMVLVIVFVLSGYSTLVMLDAKQYGPELTIHDIPLTVSFSSRSVSTVTLVVNHAPSQAQIEGTMIYLLRDGNPMTIDTAKLYDSNANELATFYGNTNTWTYHSGLTNGDLKFQPGMRIHITYTNGNTSGNTSGNTNGIREGDMIMIRNQFGLFAESCMTV